MLEGVIERFRWWIVSKEVRSATFSLANALTELSDCVNSLSSRVEQLEDDKKSRTEAMSFIASAPAIEPIKPTCDDCISMRLEIDFIKSRLDALEIARNGGVDSKPKRARRKSDAK